MKHKAKSFIAVLLALCLMMSLGVGALADGGSYGGDTPGGNTTGGDDTGGGETRGGDSPEEGPGSELPEPEAPTQYTVSLGYADNIITPNVTYSVAGGESSVVSNGAHIPRGATITVSATAKEGYSVGNITYSIGGSEQSLENGGTFVLTGNAVIKIHNVKLYKVTCETATGGTVTADKHEAAEGESVTITASPSDLYTLDTLTVDGSTVEATKQNDDTFDYTFTMPAYDVTVSATFKKVEIPPEPPVVETEHDVHIVNSEGGIVNANPDEAVEGATINLTNGSDYRHYFVGYNVRTASGQPVTVRNDSFTMPDEDVYVKGIFKLYQPTLDWHSIDVDKPYYSSVTVDSWAYETETVTFTVDTWYDYDYYSVSVWTDGGSKVSLSSLGGDKYSFTMPDDDVTIYVDYS